MTTQTEITAGEIAADVRAVLARRNISGRRLARTLGVTQASLARRISGQVDFTVPELHRIAAELNLPLAELIPSAFAERAAS